MRLLILGGTIFLGRHLVDEALSRGHQVTLFNRGQHNPDLFPEVEKLRGDRKGDLASLRGHQWDAAIDTCGYIPRDVRESAGLLADAVDHYTFVSSISVYSDVSDPGMDESAPVGTLEDPTVEEITGETYGPLKALCEQAAEAAMPGRVLNVRPGLIVGPLDFTDRFTYWPYRVSLGGEVLAPEPPEMNVQFIDGRDLARWMLRMAEARATGVYNATGPAEPLTMKALLEESRRICGSDATFTWVNESFLEEQGVAGWTELPLWVPSKENAYGIGQIDVSKAIAAGLKFRPLDAIVRDTLEWNATRPPDREWRAGLKRDREQQVLQAWHARQK